MRPFVRGERWRERQSEEGDGQVLARLSFLNFGGKWEKMAGRKVKSERNDVWLPLPPATCQKTQRRYDRIC